jgi:hypothetical protein
MLVIEMSESAPLTGVELTGEALFRCQFWTPGRPSHDAQCPGFTLDQDDYMRRLIGIALACAAAEITAVCLGYIAHDGLGISRKIICVGAVGIAVLIGCVLGLTAWHEQVE